MTTEKFTAQNIKCGGCANNIKTNLSQMEGISQVEVDIESGLVTITGSELSRTVLAEKLTELGYPEV